MSWRAVSADASSFPYRTKKLRVIGHGIDTEFYSPPPPPESQNEGGESVPPALTGFTDSLPSLLDGSRVAEAWRNRSQERLVVQVGRLAAIKHQATTIAAVAGTEARLALIGGVQSGRQQGI